MTNFGVLLVGLALVAISAYWTARPYRTAQFWVSRGVDMPMREVEPDRKNVLSARIFGTIGFLVGAVWVLGELISLLP